MDEETRREIASLAGETLALQTLLFEFFVTARNSGHFPDHLAKSVFDRAANTLEGFAIAAGHKARPEHLAGALGVVEQLRAQFLKT
ncbi:hypothetical protein [Hypericibacter adhaerens]|uniref:hypothetical protein n=1 Tax=Hypericibacter adhaerens TaxID=2602016 RepID=UPI001247DCB6|nr:hypothetical protein [Hypericibacter adhaerens]